MASSGVWWFVWRLWKWLVRLFTGRCELQRICSSNAPVGVRTCRIEQSLRHSRSPALRQVVKSEVEEAIGTIARHKKIPLAANPQFGQRLRSSLTAIRQVRVLSEEVEGVRKKPYDQENQEHEQMLMELWAGLMPGTALETRISKQWQDIGFQGNNPATDFRGMGLLGLQCLVHLSTHHTAQARSLLSRSHHPQYSYPLAVAGIHVTSRLYSWLREGHLKHYLYSKAAEEPPSLPLFMEMYCYVFVRFDEFWRSSKPESIMQFQPVEDAFFEQLMEKLLTQQETLDMQLR